MQEQLSLLNRISDELNADLHPDRMLRRVLDLTVAHLNATTGSVMLLDQQNRVSAFILQQEDLSSERAATIVGTILTEGFAGWVLKNGRGDVIHDTRNDERWLVYDNQPYDVRSVISTPLRRRQRVIGVLTLVQDEPHQFKETDLPLLEAIAGQAAIALENAHLFRQTEQERIKLSAIINSTQDAVLVTNSKNETLLVNPAARDILGLKREPTPLQPLTELTDNLELLRILSPNSPSSGEVPLPDGRTMWANVVEIPEMGRVTVLQDISAFKALDKLKRDFVTAFTHDLRTPLATLKGYIELVRMDGPITVRQEEDLDGMSRAANLMKSLIEDLLELSRLERLEELKVEEIDFEAIVLSSLSTVRPLAISKEIDLIVAGADDTLLVQGNSVLLSRAVSNLVDNAIKYTPAGGRVNINLTKNGQAQAVVSVTDNGPGISAKDLPRVFEKFFRARPELDDTPGTGLGLAIVKTIAEQHLGQVWVESQPDKGSTFTLAIPLEQNGAPIDTDDR
ncbi:MAG: GAF domain-containing protein [Anaerolineaceae bacterium]|nr:GAF domain-containing protein [Anaerolineaceae bacterium]